MPDNHNPEPAEKLSPYLLIPEVMRWAAAQGFAVSWDGNDDAVTAARDLIAALEIRTRRSDLPADRAADARDSGPYPLVTDSDMALVTDTERSYLLGWIRQADPGLLRQALDSLLRGELRGEAGS
jgi:hypothetical protein